MSIQRNSFEPSEQQNGRAPGGASPTHDPNGSAEDTAVEPFIASLRTVRDEHPFWSSRLLRACAEGSLTREDYRFIFAQYYFYSRSFTRYVCAAMANCDDDHMRARLAENLWEEGGGVEPAKRHTEIFRRFLRDGLGVDIEHLDVLDCTRVFVQQFQNFCIGAHPMASAAFLALGTEGIVGRVYESFVCGLRRAGLAEVDLEFFRIHIGCDDEHAEVLEEMMCSYRQEPRWFETCRDAMDRALTLRYEFFEGLMDALPSSRVAALVRSVQAGSVPATGPAGYVHRSGDPGARLYSNANPSSNLEFSVERIAFGAEVLDARVVHIAPGKCNERHQHGHETLMHILQGLARILVGEEIVDAGPGDTVFVPRWATHRAENVGAGELIYLAVTDFGFASRATTGDYLAGHREKPELDRSFAPNG